MIRSGIAATVIALLLVAGALAQTSASDEAVTFQINPAHTGAHNTSGLRPPLSILWSVNLGATVSYPLIAGGSIFVLAGDSTVGNISLYALDAQTGSTIWGPVVVPNGVYWWAAAAYDNGTIFVVPDSSSPFGAGAMFAYDAATGDLLWSTTLANQYLYNSPPTALNGIVYTAGAGDGGTVYAVSETTGEVLWTAGVANGNSSSPVVTKTAVYVSYVCPNVYDFNPKTGKPIWTYSPDCDGGGGDTPVLFKGKLYVRDAIVFGSYNGGVFNATTGALEGYFNSNFAPAFSGSTGLYTETNVLTAFSVTSGSATWTAAPPIDDSFSSAPIIVNGVVYIGTAAGNVIGYSLATGKRKVSISVGASIEAGESGNYSGPQSGLAAAEGLLVVPASNYLVALSHE
jgi:outer membrane protein assembly factor BamB